MQTGEFDINLLLEKYFQGKLSGKEEEHLSAWVAETAENRLYFKQKINKLEEEAAGMELPEWKQLEARMNKNSGWKMFMKVAAAVVLVMGISWFMFSRSSVVDEPQNWTIIQVPMGKIDSVVLPDQTHVFLNAGSLLKYNDDFGKKHREVILKGEALFQVAKQKNKFIVKSTTLQATVYGTTFNFDSYPESEEAIVTLCTGSLRIESLQDKNKEHVMIPGEQVHYSQNYHEMEIREVRTEPFCDWITGKLVFKSERLALIIQKIEKKFGMKVILQSSELAEYLFSGEFPTGTSLDYILEVIKTTSPQPLEIKKMNNTVQISLEK